MFRRHSVEGIRTHIPGQISSREESTRIIPKLFEDAFFYDRRFEKKFPFSPLHLPSCDYPCSNCVGNRIAQDKSTTTKSLPILLHA